MLHRSFVIDNFNDEKLPVEEIASSASSSSSSDDDMLLVMRAFLQHQQEVQKHK